MSMEKQPNQKGIIKIIILIIIALLILSYFGISLRAVINSPVTQDNISYTTTSSINIWNTYLKKPTAYIWNDIFINLIWNPAINNINNINNIKSSPSILTSPTSTPQTIHL